MSKQIIETLKKGLNNKHLSDTQRKSIKAKIEELEKAEGKTEAKKEKVVKQPKEKKEKVVKQPKEKKETTSVVDYDCDDLIAKEKDKAKKRKAAAEKRKDAPKKKESTKIKEGIEKLEDKVEEKVSKGKITKAEIIKLIDNTKALLKSLEKQLKEFGTKKMAEGGNVGDGDKFTYMMLGRLQSDNDYYLGNGNRSANNLWAGNVDAQIKEMKRLWNSLPENGKPEWLSMEDIKEYEKEMTSDKFAKGGSIEGSIFDKFEKGGSVDKIKVGSRIGFLRPNTGRYEWADVLSIDGDNVSLVARHPKRKQWDNYFIETKERINKFANTHSEDFKDGRYLIKIKFEKGGNVEGHIFDKYGLTANVSIKGYKEDVYLTKDGKFKKENNIDSINELMVFDSQSEAFEYAEAKNHDLAQPFKIKEFEYSDLAEKMAKGGSIITDASDVQRIKNSIAEGELILRAGKSHGRKMSKEELDAVQRAVDNSKKKIGLMAEGGNLYNNVDTELIDSSAKNIYNRQGFMALRNTFLQVSKTDEMAGDKATAEYRRKVVSDYQKKEPKIFAKGGSIKRTKTAIEADKNLRAMPKGERLSHPFAIIRKANGKTFKRRNANQFGKVEGDEVYSEYRSNRTDKDAKKRF
jgi:hypothetical protein